MTSASPESARSNLIWLPIFVLVCAMIVGLPPLVARQDSVLRTFRALVEVDALAQERYVEGIERNRLVHGAIRGMLLELDPYSSYLGPDELSAFERRQAGSYVGIGVDIGMRSGRPTVIAPVAGSPAHSAGIRAGDTLISIGETKLDHHNVFDVEELLVGQPGTVVRIELLHPGDDTVSELSVSRAPILVPSVRGIRRDRTGRWTYLLDPARHIGYVRVSSFRDNTLQQFDAALASLSTEVAAAPRGGRSIPVNTASGVPSRFGEQAVNECPPHPPNGLIIDLRDNPGGVTEQAVAMVDRFVAEGLILSTITRHQAVREFHAAEAGTDVETQLVVLINSGSASSSEIVAGSLQDHGRAVIIGERSFGKGSVQQLLYLESHEAAVKLTAAYYRLPKGRVIHRTAENEHTSSWGITPDVTVPLSPEQRRRLEESWRALDDSAARDAVTIDESATDAASPRPPQEPFIDEQFSEALSVLIERLDSLDMDHESRQGNPKQP